MSRVLMFPGQSSADPLMVHRALAMHESAHAILAEVHDVLGPAAVDRYTAPSGAVLACNRDIQLAVFIATQMHLRALRAEGLDDNTSLGLSLGEYSHLVHIGALTFAAALALVDARGAAYDESPRGAMVTILGASLEQVEEAVDAGRSRGAVVISNYNAPTQHVLAGESVAVAWTADWLEENHGASAIQTESRVPMHSPLLAPVAAAFAPALERARWQVPVFPYRSNVSGRPEPAASPGVFVERLRAHVTEPVRWRPAIEDLAERKPDAVFVEVGPGEVLHNMLARRWLRVRRARTDDRNGADPAGHFQSVVRELRAES